METHPVPKNVLSVEFKLFGSLTVKQFMKILGGAMAAVVIFALGIPPLISIPLMIVVVLYGVASALFQGFETKVSALIKAMFVSPRYVWRKGDNTPSILEDDQIKANTNNQTKQKEYSATDKQDDTELSIERLLNSRAVAKEEASDLGEEGNFGQVYNQIYAQQDTPPVAATGAPQIATQSQNLAGAVVSGVSVPVGPNATTTIRPVQSSGPRPATTVIPQQPVAAASSNPGLEQLTSLQQQLAQLNKQNASAEQKQAVLDQINQLYVQSGGKQVKPRELEQGKPAVFGVVVNKSNQPISGAQVQFSLADGQVLPGVAMTGSDGRFKYDGDLQPNDYVVDITHPQFKFTHYRVKVEAGKLPAYKFRSNN